MPNIILLFCLLYYINSSEGIPSYFVLFRSILHSVLLCVTPIYSVFFHSIMLTIKKCPQYCVFRRSPFHLGITPIYGSSVKSPCDCQPLQFHGHNFNAVRTSNHSSFVGMSTKLHTFSVTRWLFGPT